MNKVRINNQIKAREVRVVDEKGENLGVLPLEKALAIAFEKNLDLIEVAPEVSPPVTRILSFDKYRYQQKKEERKKKRQQKSKEMKRVRITPRAAKNDLEIKAKRASGFLESGHRVEVNIFLRGREKANKDFAKKKLIEFLEMIEVPHETAAEPRYAGRGFVVQVAKK